MSTWLTCLTFLPHLRARLPQIPSLSITGNQSELRRTVKPSNGRPGWMVPGGVSWTLLTWGRILLSLTPGGSSNKEPVCQCRRYTRCRFDPRVGKIPWRMKWQPAAVFLPGELRGQRKLAGYSPWGRTESDMVQPLSQHILAQGHRRLPLRGKARHSQLKPGQFMDAEVAKEEEAVTLGAQNRPNFSSRYGWLDISPIQQKRMLKPSAIRVHRR